MDQAKGYAECKRLNVRFVFSSNGHQFVEFDCFTGLTSAPKRIPALKNTPADTFDVSAHLFPNYYEDGQPVTLTCSLKRANYRVLSLDRLVDRDL